MNLPNPSFCLATRPSPSHTHSFTPTLFVIRPSSPPAPIDARLLLLLSPFLSPFHSPHSLSPFDHYIRFLSSCLAFLSCRLSCLTPSVPRLSCLESYYHSYYHSLLLRGYGLHFRVRSKIYSPACVYIYLATRPSSSQLLRITAYSTS